MNYRKSDRLHSYRFYRALQRQKSPMRYICEIFGAPRFSSFSTQSSLSGLLVMAGQKREARLRARRPGHPRLGLIQKQKDVDARVIG
jgi:hypothetical protein